MGAEGIANQVGVYLPMCSLGSGFNPPMCLQIVGVGCGLRGRCLTVAVNLHMCKTPNYKAVSTVGDVVIV